MKGITPMQIRRLSLAEGARAAEGLAGIIDVFRAFTCEPLMFHCGARRRILEGGPGAGRARITDVFRASTCEPLMFHCGARRIILEGDPEACRAFRSVNPEVLLV